jgi:hypothetical protein
LKQQTLIQKIIAFVLLIVFAVSITPKTYFHDAIAHHKDVVSCHHPEPGSSCVHNQPFNCHFDDLVVRAPFVIESDQFAIIFPIEYVNKQDAYLSSCSQSSASEKANRGPPVA